MKENQQLAFEIWASNVIFFPSLLENVCPIKEQPLFKELYNSVTV